MKQSVDRLALMQTFIRIVDAGSLSAAAVQLSLTQPTVSRRLQLLESTLGVTLLTRSTHAQRLTEAGVRYYQRAQEMLATWSGFESELRGTVEEPQGILRVVVPHAFGQSQLVGPLARYLAANPRVNVEWMLYDTQPNFVETGIDCAIHVGEVTDQSVVAIRIGDVPRIVAAAPSLIAAKGPVSSVEDVKNLPWLSLQPLYRNEVKLYCGEREFSFRMTPRVITDSLYALRSGIMRGVGVGLASSWALENELADGSLVQLVPEWAGASLPVYLIYPYAPFYPAKLRHFIAMIRSEANPLPWREI